MPFEVYGRADDLAAAPHGNSKAQSASSPMATLRLVFIGSLSLLDSGPETGLPAVSSGHTGWSCSNRSVARPLTDANGRFHLLIHGGLLRPGRRLRATNGISKTIRQVASQAEC